MSYDWTTTYPSATGDESLVARYRSQTTGKVWNGASMVDWVDADAQTGAYDVAATYAGGDLYGHTIPDDLPVGDTYDGIASHALLLQDQIGDKFAFAWTGRASVPGSPGSAVGVYADESDLNDWFGVDNITVYSDLSNSNTRDSARIQKWLTKADEKINLAFSRVGRTVPIPDTEADFSALSDVAAEWTGGMLAKGRGDLPANVSNRDAFDSLMDGHIERAEKALSDLVFLWSENQSDAPGTASAAGAITVAVGSPKQYPGTGCVRPPAFTLPDLSGNVSW